MADAEVDIRIKAMQEGFEQALAQADKLLDQIDEIKAQQKAQVAAEQDAARQRQMFLTELNSGLQLAQRAFGAFKQVIDFGREGAQLEYLKGKFDNLAESIGTTGDVLLGKLRNATSNMMSDAELMQSAGDLMALGLVKTEEEAIRLTRVAGQLGMNMNQLVLTLTNQTTMRFDALGVSVAGFDEKVQKLKKSGMDANDAFTEAFLQQAEEQLKKVGDIADTDAGKIMQMDAAVKNLSDSIKLQLAPALADFAGYITLFLTGQDQMRTAIEEHSGAVGQSSKRWIDYASEMKRAIEVTGRYVTAKDGQLKVLVREGGFVRDVTDEFDLLTEAQFNNQKAAEAQAEAAEGVNQAISAQVEKTNKLGIIQEVVTDKTKALANYQKELKDRLSELDQLIAGRLGKEFDSFTQKQEDLKQKAGELDGQITKLEKRRYLTQSQKQQLQDLRGELEDTKDALDQNLAAHEDATRRILFSMLEQRAAQDGLTENEVESLNKIALQWGLVDEKTASATSAINQNIGSLETGKLDELIGLLEHIFNLPSTKEFIITTTHKDVYVQEGRTQVLGGGRAAGGDVRAGVPYWVGEVGPEVFVPSQNGTIVPNNQVGGATSAGGEGSGLYIENFSINPPPGASPQAIATMTVLALKNAMRNAGQLAYAG